MLVKDILSLLDVNIIINLVDKEESISYEGSVEEFILRFETFLTHKVDCIHPYSSNCLRIIIE